jgi:hypothetical protein
MNYASEALAIYLIHFHDMTFFLKMPQQSESLSFQSRTQQFIDEKDYCCFVDLHNQIG